MHATILLSAAHTTARLAARYRRSVIGAAISALCAAMPADATPVNWTAASSFWEIAANWNSNPALPGALDDATIDVAGIRTITVRATGSPFLVGSLALPGDDILAIAGGVLTVGGVFSNAAGTTLSGGSLILNGAGSMASLTQTGATVIGGAGVLTVAGAASLSGTHSGAGSTVLLGTSTTSGLNLDAGRILRNQGSFTLNGAMNLNPANNGGAGRIDNVAGAVFDVRTFNLSIAASGFADLNTLPGFPVINNAGTFRKSTGGNYGISVLFNNTGTLEVLAGGFNLSGGGTHAASSAINLASGGVLGLGGGTHSFEGASVSGAGTLQLTAGIMDILAAQTISSGFAQLGGVLQGTDLTLTGAATLGSTQTGPATTVLKGTSTISALNLDAGRVLRNEGTVNLTGAMNLNPADNSGAGRIDNVQGALFDVRTFNLSIVASSHPDLNTLPGFGVFNNAGVLRKSTSGGYGISVPVHNSGNIEVQAGILSLNAGGSQSGANSIASGSSLTFAGGSHDFLAGAGFSGDGTLTLSGAATVINLLAPSTIDSGFTMVGGTIQGADLTLTGTSSIAISSSLGVMSGAGTTTLRGPTGIANFSLDAGRTLRNEATTQLLGSIDLNRTNAAGAGRIVNAAGALVDIRTFNHGISATNQGATDNGLDAFVENAGIWRKSSLGNNYGIGVTFNNLVSGVVDIQTGGLTLSGGGSHFGATTLAAGASLGMTDGSHVIHAGASFSGAGTLAVSGAGTVVEIDTPLTITSAFSHTGGTITGSDLTLAGPTNLAINASMGYMTGPSTTTLQGPTTMGGANAFGLDAKRVLRNEGNLVLAGSIQLNRTDAIGAGRIENTASGTIDVQTFNLAISSANQGPLDTGFDARLDNAGTLKKTTTGNYTIGVPVFNTGVISVEKGILTFSAGLAGQSGRVVVTAGTTFSHAGTLDNRGVLQGTGTISAAAVLNNGIVRPGFSPGTLTIAGAYAQGSDGMLAIELQDLTHSDALQVTGTASLAGNLAVSGLGGYLPVVGDSFVILSSTGLLSGAFDGQPTVSGFGANVDFNVLYDYAQKTVTLQVAQVTAVPEPSIWSSLLLGLGAVGWAARRRPRAELIPA